MSLSTGEVNLSDGIELISNFSDAVGEITELCDVVA